MLLSSLIRRKGSTIMLQIIIDNYKEIYINICHLLEKPFLS